MNDQVPLALRKTHTHLYELNVQGKLSNQTTRDFLGYRKHVVVMLRCYGNCVHGNGCYGNTHDGNHGGTRCYGDSGCYGNHGNHGNRCYVSVGLRLLR